MSTITLLTDFGLRDHFVAALKAKIFSLSPNTHIIDISHQIELGNYIESSYQLKSVYREFPKGTVHLFSINSLYSSHPDFIAVEYKDWYFVGPDNGLLGLVIDGSGHKTVNINPDKGLSTFPSRDIMADAAVKLSLGNDLSSVGISREDFQRMMPRSLRATREQIIGNVIYIDEKGNLITNVEKEIFEKLSENKAYQIKFGREYAKNINRSYNDVEPGDCFLLFNSSGYLEIGINQGRASQLLGLTYDSPVIITFE